MKIQLPDTTEASSSHHLILLFAGWGMSPSPFKGLDMPGYDIAIVWDYRDMQADWTDALSEYAEIVVVAWSFGVHAACKFLYSHPSLPVTARIAVNGTRFTVDDARGIPRAIFDGTLAGLDARSLTKFNMRMCGGSSAYRSFAVNAPRRGVDELKEELHAFDTAPAPMLLWDKAFISKSDLIIPPANQYNAWTAGEAVEIIRIDGVHLPDFNYIFRRCLTDKMHVERRFRRAENTYNDNALVQSASAAKLLEIASTVVSTRPSRLLEIGCGTGCSTALAIESFRPDEAVLWDLHISPQVETLAVSCTGTHINTLSCDAETEVRGLPAGSVDMVLSASAVQWLNSLPSFLRNVERVLSSGGHAVISTFGPDTMKEIYQTAGIECRFPGADCIQRMIPCGLKTVHLSEERITEQFASAMDVLRHVSRTGVNGLSADNGSAMAARLLRDYPVDADGCVSLTYHPIYMILQKQ